jgi:hypothetical protein
MRPGLITTLLDWSWFHPHVSLAVFSIFDICVGDISYFYNYMPAGVAEN